MSVKITDIAVMHDTKEIIAVGTGFCALLDNADAAGVWDKKPGSGAPYFCTSAESKEFFGAWYREGFWADHNPDGTAIVRPKAEIEYDSEGFPQDFEAE